MKTINKRILPIICSCCIVGGMLSCEKFVDIDPAANLVETSKIFSSEVTTESSILGVYEFMRSSNLSLTNGGLSLYHGLGADELQPLVPNQNYEHFYNNAIPVNSGTANLFWGAGYRLLYRTNAVMEGVIQSQELNDSYKADVLGEMSFLRAFFHFLLLTNFSDIPTMQTANYADNMIKGREDEQSVYQLIIDDLHFAVENLPDSHPVMGIYRVNKLSAMAFLARVYLYSGDWEQALVYSEEVTANPKFNLVKNIDEVFLPESKENLWAVSSQFSNTAEASVFVPFSSSISPAVKFSDSWVEKIDQTDPRWVNWTGVWLSDDGEYHYPFKYKNNQYTSITEQLIVLRLAEQYLIQAEALWRLGRTDEAITVLNTLRESRGATLLDEPGSEAQWLDAILNERKLELFCEWGHRWFDLRRLDLLDNTLSVVKGNWHSHARNLPIPESELLINVYLEQNKGYE